jgi:hypothetical protein
MLQLSKNDKDKVLKALKAGKIDAADVNFPNLIVILSFGLIEFIFILFYFIPRTSSILLIFPLGA